jgi:hypothetical protein
LKKKIKNKNEKFQWDTQKNDDLFMKKMILINDKYDDIIDSDDENETDKKENNSNKVKEKNVIPIKKSVSEILPSSSLNKQFHIFKKITESSLDKGLMKNKTKSEKIEEVPIIQSLENIRGLLGTKFKYEKIKENNYKPWDFITIKSKKLIKYYSDAIKEKQLFH